MPSSVCHEKNPLHKELFFEDQSAVDQFIAEDSTRKSTIIVNVSLIHSFSDAIESHMLS